MSSVAPVCVINFHGDEIEAIERDGELWVAIPKLCQNLGIDISTQREKIFSEPTRFGGRVIPCPSPGGLQETLCIPVERVAAWLFSINANRVREDLRPKLILYQNECADVLHTYWSGHGQNQFSEIADPQIKAVMLALAEVDSVKRRQVIFDNRLDRIEARQDASVKQLEAIGTAIEWSTCIGWAKQFKGQGLNLADAGRFGKVATRRAKELGVKLSEILDPRFGRVNTYPNWLLGKVWAEVFDEVLQ
jgi:P22_AR N-terminal domain